jgi:tetratricopeptide (TPR) repeat protein
MGWSQVPALPGPPGFWSEGPSGYDLPVGFDMGLSGWLTDRYAGLVDRITGPSTRPRDRLGRAVEGAASWLEKREDVGLGAYSWGLDLLRRGRFSAAATTFDEAVRLFERDIGHEHVWTATAIAQRGRCFTQLDKPSLAVADFQEAAEIIHRVRPDDLELIAQYEALVRWSAQRQQSTDRP